MGRNTRTLGVVRCVSVWTQGQRALAQAAIPADGNLNGEEMTEVLEYLCDKGLEPDLLVEPAMGTVLGRIVRLTTEFEVSAAAEGRRLA